MSDRPTPDRILQLGFGFWASKVLLSAVELGLFSELAQGPLDADTLRERLGIHPRGARDFFDAPVALGMLERRADRYANMPETDTFLDRAKPTYVGGLLAMASTRSWPTWTSLTDGLRTGQPQNEAGPEGFAALYADPERLKLFVRAMTPASMGPSMALARTFPWDRYRTVVDVGTAEGGVPVRLALEHAHLTGGGFDLPPVGPIFQEYVERFGLADRLRFYPGDFFADPLPRADVLIMGHVLHGLDLEGRRMLLAKAHEALPEGGALIVYDNILDDERRQNVFGLLMSLNMQLETTGGGEYVAAECQGWMREAGFRETSQQHLAGPVSMVVGTK